MEQVVHGASGFLEGRQLSMSLETLGYEIPAQNDRGAIDSVVAQISSIVLKSFIDTESSMQNET